MIKYTSCNIFVKTEFYFDQEFLRYPLEDHDIIWVITSMLSVLWWQHWLPASALSINTTTIIWNTIFLMFHCFDILFEKNNATKTHELLQVFFWCKQCCELVFLRKFHRSYGKEQFFSPNSWAWPCLHNEVSWSLDLLWPTVVHPRKGHKGFGDLMLVTCWSFVGKTLYLYLAKIMVCSVFNFAVNVYMVHYLCKPVLQKNLLLKTECVHQLVKPNTKKAFCDWVILFLVGTHFYCSSYFLLYIWVKPQ